MSPTTERFAAIDVGSNSIRCLIAERGEDGHLQIIDDLKDQPRLARGTVSAARPDWDSITAAAGPGSRPPAARTRARSASCSRASVPSSRQPAK